MLFLFVLVLLNRHRILKVDAATVKKERFAISVVRIANYIANHTVNRTTNVKHIDDKCVAYNKNSRTIIFII